MLEGKRVRLRSIARENLALLWEFNNNLEVELAGGGDPPTPQSFARLQAEFDQEVTKGGRDGPAFAIEADGKFIGQCALFNINPHAQTCELGITIGDKDYWGAVMDAKVSLYWSHMRFSIAISTKSGSKYMPAIAEHCVPMQLAAFRKKGNCAPTFGVMVNTMI